MNMQWKKLGLIFETKKHLPTWATNSALQPTPILLNENCIRIYVGLRDAEGISRVGFVDVSAKDPVQILQVSDAPCLDIGRPGAFDDNGVVPSALIKIEGKFYMFYAGYHLSNKIRFSVFSGLAVSDDGVLFKRVQEVPVFERTDAHLLFRVPHSVIFENGQFKFWYGGGRSFITHNNYTLPVYDIYYCESLKLTEIPKESRRVLTFSSEDEYRVARPFVVKEANLYKMFFCSSTKTKGYRLAYAESRDGIHWDRNDKKLNLDVSSTGWDSQMRGYPGYIKTSYGTYLFYNGNDYGKEGFGVAILETKGAIE